MSGEEKRAKPKEKKSGEAEKKILAKKITNLPGSELSKQIEKAIVGLYYVSETDAEIKSFVGEKAEAVGKETILSQSESATDSPIEEKDFTAFFARLTAIQNWFGDEEIETAKKFTQLKELLEKNLRDLKVFKIGKAELDVYVVGLDAENNLLGIKTKAIET